MILKNYLCVLDGILHFLEYYSLTALWNFLPALKKRTIDRKVTITVTAHSNIFMVGNSLAIFVTNC